MELRVESAEGTVMPKGCYVGVRVGETLKQGRYEPNRSYHFPRVDRRRNAKIDVYQHVGSCVVALDPDTKSTNMVKVESTNPDPAFAGMRLKVDVQQQSDAVKRKQREARAVALRGQAQEYLQKHGIEERLAEAVKQLLQDQPSDPIRFICSLLQGGGTAAAAPAKPSAASPAEEAAPAPAAAAAAQQQDDLQQQQPVEATEKGEAEKTPEQEPEKAASPDSDSGALENLRQRTAEVLVNACESGHMSKVLDQVRDNQPASTPAAEVVKQEVVLDRSRVELLPPMVPMATMLGPGYASFGVSGVGFSAGCALFI